jgi:peptidoglycan/LPS O-acetylase OafA/YrhL
MSTSKAGRISSLDGVRAVSILMVLYGHLSGTRDFPNRMNDGWGNALGDIAHLGVLVFFVISGFLITSLLMSEREKTGTISLGKFYLRRVLRIFPAFYALILALSAVAWLGWIDLTGRDFAYALTYTVNYYPHHPWQIGHLWSLSIEEQFYLLWPLALLALRQRRALILAVFAILAGPVVRAGIREWAFHVDPSTPLAGMSIFPAMCDYLATGCALALLRPWLLKQGWYLRLTGSRWLVLAIPVILLINRESGYTLVELVFSPVLNIGIALLIESSTRHADSLAGRFLNWKPVAFLGVLSYSLYLWQQPFLNRHSDAWWNAFPQNVACAFVCALLSYLLIERAFLGLRKRLERTDSLPTRTPSVAALMQETVQTEGGTAIAMPPSEPT